MDEQTRKVLEKQVTAKNKLLYDLLFAAMDGSLGQVQSLVEQGVDCNKENGSPFTYPLVGASREGHLEVVKYLLDHGADVNGYSIFASTSLFVASCNGHIEVVRHLIERGANVNHTNSPGYPSAFFAPSALFAAARNGHGSVVECLLEKGADVHQVTERQLDQLSKGSNALMAAAAEGAIGAVGSLLAHGADVNARDNDRLTALIYAARNGHNSVVKLLLDKGAKLAQQGGSFSQGFGTALDFATRGGHLEVAEVLRSKAGSTQQAQGCFVATAVYGSSEAPAVWVLRRWRDEVLLRKAYGPPVVAVYYRISPPLAAACRKLPFLRWCGRRCLDVIVNQLRRRNSQLAE